MRCRAPSCGVSLRVAFSLLGSARVAETAAARAGAYYFHLLDIGVTWCAPGSGSEQQGSVGPSPPRCPRRPFAWSKGLDWDVWSANFSAQCTRIAAAEVPLRAADPYLIAWQTDNEVRCALSAAAAACGTGTPVPQAALAPHAIPSRPLADQLERARPRHVPHDVRRRGGRRGRPLVAGGVVV